MLSIYFFECKFYRSCFMNGGSCFFKLLYYIMVAWVFKIKFILRRDRRVGWRQCSIFLVNNLRDLDLDVYSDKKCSY